ncbi:MAG: hypothetical protein ACLPUO_04710 [Streptosporangiaceae bacterium]
MTDSLVYYAIVDHRSTRQDPAGIARRRQLQEGGFRDEALNIDLNWRFTPLIVEWKRAESTDDLVEVPEEEAQQIIERLRERWAASG